MAALQHHKNCRNYYYYKEASCKVSCDFLVTNKKWHSNECVVMDGVHNSVELPPQYIQEILCDVNMIWSVCSIC